MFDKIQRNRKIFLTLRTQNAEMYETQMKPETGTASKQVEELT